MSALKRAISALIEKGVVAKALVLFILEAVIITTHFTQDLADEEATLAFASLFAKTLIAGQVIYLHGDLGAGKTTFVRGILHALSYVGKVKSPTYNLVEHYALAHFQVVHFDLYRFNDEEEWEEAGFRDYFNAQSVCFIEWPEKAQHILPTPDMDIFINMQHESRTLKLTAQSPSALTSICQLS